MIKKRISTTAARSPVWHGVAFLSNKTIDYFSTAPGINIDLFSKDSPEYSVIEDHIYAKLKKKYSFDTPYSFPYLLSLTCNNHICATIGICAAESGPLFLEKYLKYPVEQEIGMCFKTAIRRESIVEAGNVISSWRGNNQLLFILLLDLLLRSDREWLTLFSNKEIDPVLKKINFTTIPLSQATVKMFADGKEQWGSYFHVAPRIVVLHIPSAMALLKQTMFMSFTLSLFSKRLSGLACQWKHRSE